jgi:MFS family permease
LLTSAIGITTGPLVGGLFAEYTTWRWAFYIDFPFCAVGPAMTFSTARLRAEQRPLKDKFWSLDWSGGVIFIANSSSFLIGVS